MKTVSTTTKKVPERIAQFAAFLEEVKARAIAGNYESDREYIANCRYAVNVKLIELCAGATFISYQNKKGVVKNTLKFNAKRPNSEQIAEISNIMNAFCTWEDSYIDEKPLNWNTLAPVVSSTGEDLSVDSDETAAANGCTLCYPVYKIPELKKVSGKIISEVLFGVGDCLNGAAYRYLDSQNVLELVALGDKIHKRNTTIMWVCIGIGVLALVGGGTAVAICCYNKSHKNVDDDPDDSDDSDDLTDEEIDALEEGAEIDDVIEVTMEFV